MEIKLRQIKKNIKANSHSKHYLLHRYWGRKAHNVVHEYIKNYTKENDVVLDPFMGGGTSIVEGMRLGRKTVGVDLNYISFFVSKVKTTILKPEQREFIEEWVTKFDESLKNKIVLDKFTKTALSLINYKGLGKGQIYRLKQILSGCSYFLKNLKKVKNRKINNVKKIRK